MAMELHPPPSSLPAHIRKIHDLDDVWRAPSAGEKLDRARALAPRARKRIIESGRVLGARTFDLTDVPYPTTFAFAGAASSLVPYILMRNRMNLVQFTAEDGKTRTLLMNPTDVERSAETPYFADMRRRMGEPVARAVLAAFKRPTVGDHLAAAGIKPEAVDYVAFDHLHTQDLRGLLGTAPTRENKDIPRMAALLPRAKLLIWQPELDILRSLHPLQKPWFIADALRGVPSDRVLPCDGDLLLGKGVALIRTPGHTAGNWSLVINTDNGVWTVSENGVAADSYAPEASRIPGLRAYARETGFEVVLNSNTLEGRNDQYTSMIIEKIIADKNRDNPAFVQHQPSSEIIKTPFFLGLKPTFHYGGVSSGELKKAGA